RPIVWRGRARGEDVLRRRRGTPGVPLDPAPRAACRTKPSGPPQRADGEQYSRRGPERTSRAAGVPYGSVLAAGLLGGGGRWAVGLGGGGRAEGQGRGGAPAPPAGGCKRPLILRARHKKRGEACCPAAPGIARSTYLRGRRRIYADLVARAAVMLELHDA